jgi:hypothetical protein
MDRRRPRERDIEQWVAWANKKPVDPAAVGPKRAEEVMRLREVGANNLALYGLTPRGKAQRKPRK